MAIGNLQTQQPGFNVFQQNERMQPQVSIMTGIDGAPQLPDFSFSNQFGGNPFMRGGGGIGGFMTSAAGNPFALTAAASGAFSALPTFGGGSGGGAGGGTSGALNSAAAKIAASADKLVAALDKLTAALGGGPGSPGAPGSPGSPNMPSPGGPPGIRARLATMGAGFTGALAGMTAYNNASGYLTGLQANVNQSGMNIDMFNQSLGGLGGNYRQMNVQDMVAKAQAQSGGGAYIRGGQGLSIAGGATMLAGALLSFTGVGASVGVPMMIAGAGGLGGGQALDSYGRSRIYDAGEEARRRATDKTSAEYQAKLEEDRQLMRARRAGAVGSAFTVSSLFAARAQFPGGEGVDAIYRSNYNSRRAARASALGGMGNTIIPFELQGFNFLNNISLNARRFNDSRSGGFFEDGPSGVRQLRFGGSREEGGKTKLHAGLFGGPYSRGNMFDYTGQMTQALGIGNLDAINDLNEIVGAQGFTGIGTDYYTGAIANFFATTSKKRREFVTNMQKRGDEALVRISTPRVSKITDYEYYLTKSLRHQAGNLSLDHVTGAGARLMGGLGGIYGPYTTTGDYNNMAAQISGVNDPSGLLRSPNNIQSTMTEILTARQLGFSNSTVAMMARVGQGGLGTQAFLNMRQLTGETNFLGLRGSGAQAYLQGRIGFLESFANRGINLGGVQGAVPGFANAAMARISMPHAQVGTRNPSTFFQPGFADGANPTASNQLLGEIATVVNLGRGRRMQSFMGAQYGNRANELMAGNASITERLRGTMGGFGEEILFAHALAASGGSRVAAMKMMDTMGPITKRNIIAGVVGGDRAATMEGLVSLPGMSVDTAQVLMDAPNRLEELPQKTRDLLRNAMSSSAAAAKGEAEAQQMGRFNRTNFRMLKISEAMKISMEGSALTLNEILQLLKGTIGSGRTRKRKPTTPTPPPPPSNPNPPAPRPEPMGPASDIRLKKDIDLIGKSEMGLNIYSFRYIDEFTSDNTLWKGVMAQEVMEIIPEAVYTMDNGFYAVNYELLDVNMERM